MNKVRVIDLLNKIANGEEVPKKINYMGKIFEYKLWLEPSKYAYVEEGTNNTLEEYCCFYDLTDEVEIIEEDKKIEKFDPCLGGIMSFNSVENIFEIYKDKINEIIDYINKENKCTSYGRKK